MENKMYLCCLYS